MQGNNMGRRFHNHLKAAAAAGLLVLSQAALADLSNKWRLEFSGNAESAGSIVLRVTPQTGAPIDADVIIPVDTAENEVAETVMLGLQSQLPSATYAVERDDGEDVLIKAMDGAGDFSVAVASNTVDGVRINPDKE